MSRGTIIRYLCIPAIIAVGALAFAVRSEPLGLEMLLSIVGAGFLFYAAPYLIWGFIVSAVEPSRAVSHAGFLAASVALAAITLLSFFGHDPSGLPVQWFLYWPLAIVLQVVFVSTMALYARLRSKVGA